jgi:predicted transposase YbfD/YdcC
MESPISIIRYFEPLEDPRILLKTAHKLIDIIVIAICAVISGADKWTQVEAFGHAREEWFKQFLALPHGIPSHDTFGRVFSRIQAKQFLACFQQWIQAVFEISEGQVVAIDGKTLRRSYDKPSKKAALHMIHAWASANGVLLGQLKTQEKSNEITAIPELLAMLKLKGCIVTLDAMGCQKKIAEQIHQQQADYVLAVKENQGQLKTALANLFASSRQRQFEAMVYSQYETVEKAHGQIEKRTCYVLPLMYLHAFKLKWKGLQSLVLVESEKDNGQVNTIEQRYYISSLKMDAMRMAQVVR